MWVFRASERGKKFRFTADVTPPELSCPENITAETLPDRRYAAVRIPKIIATGANNFEITLK